MEWTTSDTEKLRAWRNLIDSDNIKIKEKIKEELLNNRAIIHVIGNHELEEEDAEPEDYYGVNIFPYVMRFMWETICRKLSNCWKLSLDY